MHQEKTAKTKAAKTKYHLDQGCQTHFDFGSNQDLECCARMY